jgi:hypothetical protein
LCRRGTEAGTRPRHDGPDREILRLHRAADFAGLEVGGDDREGALVDCDDGQWEWWRSR